MVMSTAEALQTLFRYGDLSNRPIGRGGCGQIWRAHDRLFDRTVAIKTIDENLMWNSSVEARRAFIKEAQAGARLGQFSRNVVQVLDMGFATATPYFTMEWIDPRKGRSEIDISADLGAVSMTGAKAIMFDVCEAVKIAHKNGIVHSDIAPWNIVYDPNLRVNKLADFGLLKILEERLVSAGSGSLLTGGRANFMPANVLLRKEVIGYASDIYALAVTLRALVEGVGCLNKVLLPTPPVIRVKQKGGADAPRQLQQLLARFIDDHTIDDNIDDFEKLLSRVPN